MRPRMIVLSTVAVLAALLLPALAAAHAPSGAIFTTLADGTEVNQNLFPNAEAVYLDGGPGPGAPAGAAGLDDGTYVFQVTDPSGKTLLSTDLARCRQFTVSGGIITGVVDTDCEHATGLDVDHGATTVQLFPFNLTPNPGGVFKVWATPLEDYLAGCTALGVANGLDVVDCGNAPGNRHGFIPAHSKTDNFKIKEKGKVREIDVRFFRDLDGDGRRGDWATETLIGGLRADWTDTVGARNQRHSDPGYFYGTFAHVEAPEVGVHTMDVLGGSGCAIGAIHLANWDSTQLVYLRSGPGPVTLEFHQGDRDPTTYYLDVAVTGC